jgi:hypothetical protein
MHLSVFLPNRIKKPEMKLLFIERCCFFEQHNSFKCKLSCILYIVKLPINNNIMLRRIFPESCTPPYRINCFNISMIISWLQSTDDGLIELNVDWDA